MKEVDNILRIFKEVKKAINENNSYKIKILSNQTIHSATIFQDPDNIIVAVLVYALSKITEREHYRTMPGWESFHKNLLKNWDLAIKYLENSEIEKFRVCIGKIRNSINKISGNLRGYMQDVFHKAGINKAFKIYEHGLSSEQTAEVLGVSLWDLATYIGQSTVSEAKIIETMPVKKRIKIAENIFT